MFTLREARERKAMSQKEAGNAFGVHYQTIAKWESDNSRMPHDKIQLIQKVYGVPADEIFFGKENEFTRL